ncbi:MAG: hypothetical protein JJT76_19960 [Clostridiaceae bacterium]|nr:hypothetical protein [Clostridiaceae bacterium]
MQKLSSNIPTYVFMQENSHLWWLIRTCIFIAIILIVGGIVYDLIGAIPYIAVEGIGIIFSKIGEGFEMMIDWIVEKFQGKEL